jgi:hypothetical protein
MSLLKRLTMRKMVPEDYMSSSCSVPLLAYKLFYGFLGPGQWTSSSHRHIHTKL